MLEEPSAKELKIMHSLLDDPCFHYYIMTTDDQKGAMLWVLNIMYQLISLE